MNNKSILDILDILEQIVNTCRLLSKEVYSSLDYSNSTFDMCADKFEELELKIWKLQAAYKDEDYCSRKEDVRYDQTTNA